ncbi:glycosyl hydrolase 115 family protein [Mesobacillus foraminis]|uniref:glycosyl hydrolase 115 family protein n=1 Tax=Mesobacillus foraminis TaxID=279826 RepID=UPI0039A375E7
MSGVFIFNKETILEYQGTERTSIRHFLKVLARDMEEVFLEKYEGGKTTILFLLDESNPENLEPEQFKVEFSEDLTQMKLSARDELGIIYGILRISETWLGVDKFWFWNDCEPPVKSMVPVEPVDYLSHVSKTKFRGWFINDEVLISTWRSNGSNREVWEMVFEALLRCNGNMVIPGTDIENPVYKKMASEMGLWITHHHAEPLGARMFSRVFPDKKASYTENKELFQQLWREAIREQKDNKVIWNIGFRGQGDRPFWVDDPAFDTDEKRGALISEIIRDQYDMIDEVQKNPICCVNLYGEITELYKQGLLEFPEGVIKVWADSGYGKMVSRRQGSHNPRVPSIASRQDQGPHGIYYHVTFYDLQASNHLTMLPNTPEFVKDELTRAFDHEMSEFLIVNCGNIRPHLYFLDFVSELWTKGDVDEEDFLSGFVSRYYPSHSAEMSKYTKAFFDAVIPYGNFEDERAGEQFYHFTIRNLAKQWIVSQGSEPAKNLFWATGEAGLKEQFDWFQTKAADRLPQWEELASEFQALAGDAQDEEQKRIRNQLHIQVLIHKNGCKALHRFTQAFERFRAEDHLGAYLLVNDALNEIRESLIMMQEPTDAKWEGFYENDCLTNVSLTEYVLETVRRNLRMLGDGPAFYQWEKQYLTSAGERAVMLLTNKTKQLMDDQLAEKLEKSMEQTYSGETNPQSINKKKAETSPASR